MADEYAAPILERFRQIGLEKPVHSHPPALTVQEWEPIIRGLGVDGVLTKCLFMKGKKDDLHLIAARHDTETKGKLLNKVAKDLRFAADDVLKAVLNVEKGSVSPLALVNDAKQQVQFSIDKRLTLEPAQLLFHPGSNERTVALTYAELVQFLTAIGVKVNVVDFAEEAAAPAAAGAADTAAPAAAAGEGEAGEKEHQLGITFRKEDATFSDWYQQVITRSEMLDYYDISGCYIIRPWAFSMWKVIQNFFGSEIEKLGVEDAYFPMFVSQAALEREKDHIEGFAPEVAWVTKSGTSELEAPIAVRPTSETVMYPSYSKWVRSHRDLPLRLNQWCNVVRWEFSHPTPFIRTREFLWQEGHSAFADKAEAEKEVMDILDLYRRVYEDFLAVPVTPGKKTEKEKFAGGDYTTTVEAFIPTVGRSVQGATSHHLGQNFAKMFEITYEDPDAAREILQSADPGRAVPKKFAYQNSWGLTTRTLGVLVMTHADDRGLVLPPRIAPLQVVIIPCGIAHKATAEEKAAVYDGCTKLQDRLKAIGVRAKADLRHHYSPGWRFNNWELKGVPLRFEFGPKDMKTQTVLVCRRDIGSKDNKQALPLADLETSVPRLLQQMQDDMFAKARKLRDERKVFVDTWEHFTPTLNKKNVILSPCCGQTQCELTIKERSAKESAAQVDERAPSMGAKALCIPFDQPPLKPGATCIVTGEPAQYHVLFGRSY